ncbi:hypothetical protein LSM04_002053 [Trypanosoma melophagium]|uniref:uncharacterized protein n=1 Tax=Trypanosoma melophagium TaxID=715481 RepID=UPI00351A2FB6|nr:hypothetical protein LSM04_002053 [Trypanosoma melophagium]
MDGFSPLWGCLICFCVPRVLSSGLVALLLPGCRGHDRHARRWLWAMGLASIDVAFLAEVWGKIAVWNFYRIPPSARYHRFCTVRLLFAPQISIAVATAAFILAASFPFSAQNWWIALGVVRCHGWETFRDAEAVGQNRGRPTVCLRFALGGRSGTTEGVAQRCSGIALRLPGC